jgi:hypothetical protein
LPDKLHSCNESPWGWLYRCFAAFATTFHALR